MPLIARAVWYINSHSADDLSLDSIAEVVGVSRHHLAHAFGRTVGMPVMGYVRALRLTVAARSLVDGAPDILGVAIDAGYGSHEAFTRAFRDQFGVTPEALRSRGTLETLNLMDPIKMSPQSSISLPQPRFENGKALRLAGLMNSYTFQTMGGMPAQWQRFVPHIGHIASEVPGFTYGVVFGTQNGCDYLS